MRVRAGNPEQCRNCSAAAAEVLSPMFVELCSQLFSKTWLLNFLGKLWEACSRLYRSRCLQVNTKYFLESSLRDLQDLQTSATLWIQILATFRQTIRILAILFSNFHLLLAIVIICYPQFINFVKQLRNFSNFEGKDQHLLDYKLSRYFAKKLVEFSRNLFSNS